MPVAYVKVISEYLTHKKPAEAEAELRSILELFCSLDDGHKISRADLFLDFCCCDQDIIDIDPNQFITRAEVIRPYYTNRELTGYDIGLGGDLSARLYNKTLQILTSKQDYLKPLWADGGWQEDETVWRVEFQMRRPVLDRFLVTTVQDLLRHRSELWTYLTRDWLRLSVPNDDSNRSRWPLHPLWVGVWDGGCGALDVPMQKRPRPNAAPDMSLLLQSLCQPLAGLFALQNITELKAGLEWLSLNLGKLLVDHTTSKGLRLDFYVTQSIKKKIRDYNLRLNDETLGNSGNFYR